MSIPAGNLKMIVKQQQIQRRKEQSHLIESLTKNRTLQSPGVSTVDAISIYGDAFDDSRMRKLKDFQAKIHLCEPVI